MCSSKVTKVSHLKNDVHCYSYKFFQLHQKKYFFGGVFYRHKFTKIFYKHCIHIHERQKDIVITFEHQEKLIMEMVEYLTEHAGKNIEFNEQQLDVQSMTWMGEALQRFSLMKVENVEKLEAFRIRSDTEIKTNDETELVSHQ